MKKAFKILSIILFIGLFNTSCNNSKSSTKELEAAFSKMFENTTFTNATDYFKTNVSDDYFTINADGITQNKEELLADTDRLKLLESLTFKFYDQKTRIYGNVGILNGRSQAFLDGTYVAEFLYTAIFVKENETWMYTSWQGTWSKDSPPLPSVNLEE